MEPITTIGALVGIAKTLVEAIAGARALLKSQAGTKEITEIEAAYSSFQERLAVLAVQLTQSETLSRMLPVWREKLDRVPIWTQELSDDDIQRIDKELRSLIMESIHDHFSAAFFRTQFDQLPEIPTLIEDFRVRLKDLEKDLNGVPYGNAEAWRLHWPTLKVRLGDLSDKEHDLSSRVGDIRGKLVTEIESAAKNSDKN